MNKRFTAKIQNIKPSIESSSNIVSDNIVVIPESADLKARKGSVFATFCIKSEIPNDSKLITKIITDILIKNVRPILLRGGFIALTFQQAVGVKMKV